MKFYIRLFGSFFKIGVLTIGGGYAMIPFIEEEVVRKRHWLSADDFAEALTLAQSAPGPVSINSAVFVGYKMKRLRGVIATVLGTVLPSFTIIIFFAVFFAGIRENRIVESIFRGLRPAVVALIAVPVVNMLKRYGFSTKFVVISAVSAVAVAFLRISPLIVIMVSGFAGVFYYLSKNRKE